MKTLLIIALSFLSVSSFALSGVDYKDRFCERNGNECLRTTTRKALPEYQYKAEVPGVDIEFRNINGAQGAARVFCSQVASRFSEGDVVSTTPYAYKAEGRNIYFARCLVEFELSEEN